MWHCMVTIFLLMTHKAQKAVSLQCDDLFCFEITLQVIENNSSVA